MKCKDRIFNLRWEGKEKRYLKTLLNKMDIYIKYLSITLGIPDTLKILISFW